MERRQEIAVLTDWRGQLVTHQKQAVIGAAVAGFVIGGGIAGSAGCSAASADVPATSGSCSGRERRSTEEAAFRSLARFKVIGGTFPLVPANVPLGPNRLAKGTKRDPTEPQPYPPAVEVRRLNGIALFPSVRMHQHARARRARSRGFSNTSSGAVPMTPSRRRRGRLVGRRPRSRRGRHSPDRADRRGSRSCCAAFELGCGGEAPPGGARSAAARPAAARRCRRRRGGRRPRSRGPRRRRRAPRGLRPDRARSCSRRRSWSLEIEGGAVRRGGQAERRGRRRRPGVSAGGVPVAVDRHVAGEVDAQVSPRAGDPARSRPDPPTT